MGSSFLFDSLHYNNGARLTKKGLFLFNYLFRKDLLLFFKRGDMKELSFFYIHPNNFL